MAFATSNPVAGNAGNRRVVSGTWTGSVNDNAGTMDVGSANVISADFDPNKASGGPVERPLVSRSVSGAITTLTIYNKQAVTDGKFRVEYV